jgi:hypothetical protein
VVEVQTVELVEVVEDHKEIMVDQLLDLQEVWQVVAEALAVLENLVEQEHLVNKMVDQDQILVLHFQAYLTLVYMVVVAVELQEIVNLKEVLVDLVEVVMEN